MWRILVEQGIKNGKVTVKYHKKKETVNDIALLN